MHPKTKRRMASKVPVSGGMSRVSDRAILWVTGVAHASSHAWELIFPAVAVPMAQGFGVPFEDALRLSFTLYFLFGLGAPLAGWLSDRFGGWWVVLGGLGLGGVSGVFVALASDFTTLRIAFAFLGLAASAYHPAGLSLLSLRFSQRMGRAFAVNGIAGGLGIALTPLVAGLVTSVWGWKSAFVVLCVPGLLVAVFALVIGRQTTGDLGLSKSKESPSTEEPSSSSPGRLILLGFIFVAGGLIYRLHTLVVPALLQLRVPGLAYLEELLPSWRLSHVENLAATFLTTLAYTMGVVGQWVGGRIADRKPLLGSYLGFHLVAFPFLVALGFVSGMPLVFCLFGYVFCAIGLQPIENSLVARFTPSRWRGRAFAGKFVLVFGVGSFGTWIVGWVMPWGGLAASVYVAAGLEVFLLLMVFGLWLLVRPKGASSDA